ncbi:MAG: hypothetical protein NTV63_04800 [Candidatus Woesearchaeota archaeon]|nr:hypothetical protein [Candidatus Woesearchaeota archaeon]
MAEDKKQGAEDKKLEEIIKKCFEETKDRYLRPPISGPLIVDSEIEMNGLGTAFLNFLDLSIGINAPFLKKMAGYANGDIEKMAKGIFTHEIGHYMFFPQNVSLSLYLSYEAEENFKENSAIIYALFADYVNNSLIYYQQVEAESLKGLLASSYLDKKNRATNSAMALSYGKRMKEEFSVDLSGFEEETMKKIIKAADEIDSVTVSMSRNYNLQYSQLRRFGEAILPLLNIDRQKMKENQKNNCDKNCQNNGGQGENPCNCPSGGGSRIITKEDFDKLPAEDKQKIKQAIREMIKHMDKKKYEKIKEHFLGKESAKKDRAPGIGTGIENVESAEDKTTEYYKELAAEYGIFIRPKKTRTLSSTKQVFGKEDFKMDSPPIGIDTRYSGGKILPGLTKKIRIESIPYLKNSQSLPSLIIYKDASGSMPNPQQETCYATLAGTIFIMSYFRSGCNVGVSLFDSEMTDIFRSEDEDELIKMICSYKGGGTSIDLDRLKKDIAESKSEIPIDLKKINEEEIRKNPLFRKYLNKNGRISLQELTSQSYVDLMIITDGGIMNVDELIDFMKNNEKYRPTIIHTGTFQLDIPGYDQQHTCSYGGITVFKADSKEDLVRISQDIIEKNLISGN